MQELTIAGTKVLRFNSLPPGLVQATTTSTGWDGTCTGPALHALARALGLKKAAWMAQVHGTSILEPSPGAQGEIGVADALATDQPGLGLVIRHADCLPVVLYVSEVPAVVGVHAGWRGIVKGVVGLAVQWTLARWGVNPGEMWAGIGPGLGPCCGEFRDWEELFPSWMERFRVGQNHFNLWEAARYQLVEAGLEPSNIELAGVCTCCNEALYSYRREHNTKRCATIVGMV